MGFPEPRCDEDGDCHISQSFKDLETTVRGVPVQHRKGKLSMTKLSPVLGKVWLYDVIFEPKERVKGAAHLCFLRPRLRRASQA
jgi:hypothetical protein